MRRGELRGQGPESGQVGLAGRLLGRVRLGVGAIAERVGYPVHHRHHFPVAGFPAEPLERGAGAGPPEELAVPDLVRDAGRGERLLEWFGAGVDPVQHGHLLVRHTLHQVQATGLVHHERRRPKVAVRRPSAEQQCRGYDAGGLRPCAHAVG